MDLRDLESTARAARKRHESVTMNATDLLSLILRAKSYRYLMRAAPKASGDDLYCPRCRIVKDAAIKAEQLTREATA